MIGATAINHPYTLGYVLPLRLLPGMQLCPACLGAGIAVATCSGRGCVAVVARDAQEHWRRVH